MDEDTKTKLGKELFDLFIRDLEEQTRHIENSDAEAILEYLRSTYGVDSYCYDWSNE